MKKNLGFSILLLILFCISPFGVWADVCDNFTGGTAIPATFCPWGWIFCGSHPSIGINYSSSADTIIVGNSVNITASCENGSLSGQVGTFSPGADTTYYATCTQSDGFGGIYTATACINIGVAGNGCEASTCFGFPCHNGFGWTTGAKPINRGNYSCTYSDSLDCSLKSNCGKTNIITAGCADIRGCDGVTEFGRPMAECTAAGLTCANSTANCPGCTLKFNTQSWQEVAP